MNYPFWDVPFSYGVLMAVLAVFHVFVSHFAIGGGLYLVVTERLARAAGDERRLEFLERLSKFFVLVTLVAGALTGVGIWFIIGLISPTATEALIHHYVWGWATEWTFFIVEIAAAMIYFYGWKTMPPRAHMAVGWIYFVFAWLSLFIINGIVTFMLTPGQWLATGSFWDGFFNPTFWPSLVMRTGVCVMLAGLYALLVAARCEADGFKERLVRYSTGWGLAGLVVTAVCQYWYWKAIPAAVTAKALQTMPTPIHAMEVSVWLAAAIGALLALCGLLAPRKLGYGAAAALMTLGLVWFGAFEWFRESVRKPYVITSYIYGSGVEVAHADRSKKEGLLAQMAFKTGNDGADLFRHACRSCHTLDGYKALKPAFDGMDRAFIGAIVRATHLLRGNMPPFPGTASEAEKIADYLLQHTDRRPLAAIYKLEGVELGRKAYAVRCGGCHVIGGMRDASSSFSGQSTGDLNNMLNSAADMGEGMPAYTGDAAERNALVAFLQTLGKGGNK